jgi:hypothetical protein
MAVALPGGTDKRPNELGRLEHSPKAGEVKEKVTEFKKERHYERKAL